MGEEKNQIGQSHAHVDDERSRDEIKSNIDTTRSRMDRTLDLLSDKVDPKSVWNGFVDIFRGSGPGSTGGSGNSTMRALTRPIKENPLAAIGLAASAVWLVASSVDDEDDRNDVHDPYDPDYDYGRYKFGSQNPESNLSELGTARSAGSGEPFFNAEEEGISDKIGHVADAAKEKLASAGETISQKFGDARDAVSDKSAQARESVTHSMDSARAGARKKARQMKRTGSQIYDDASHRLESFADDTKARYLSGLRENPLGLLIGALGLGILAGVAAPVSRREEELYGEYSDEITDQIKETGEELLEKGKRVGARAAETALDEIDKSSVDTDGVSKTIDDVKKTVTDAANRVKDEAAKAAEDEGLTKVKVEEKSKSAGSKDSSSDKK